MRFKRGDAEPQFSHRPGSALPYFMDILSTRYTYRLALKGGLTRCSLLVTDYRFSLTVLLLRALRISAEWDTMMPEPLKSSESFCLRTGHEAFNYASLKGSTEARLSI